MVAPSRKQLCETLWKRQSESNLEGDAAADSRDVSRYVDQTQKSPPLRKGEQRQRRLAEKNNKANVKTKWKKSLKKVQFHKSVGKSRKQGTTKKKRSQQDFFSSIVDRA